MDAVLDELKPALASKPDHVTLSGSGEPTLHSDLGEIIERIKAMTGIPVAVLTNGSLLWQKAVREEVALADIVVPSLDAPDPIRFEVINRPHPEITFERLVDGLEAFRGGFGGEYWLEVMVLNGYTSLPPQVRELADWTRRIRPDKVQLNTAVRPPAEECAMPVSGARLTKLARLFSPRAEVIAEHRRRSRRDSTRSSAQAILGLLARRPCTVEDVAHGLSMKVVEAVKALSELEALGRVQQHRGADRVFYRAIPPVSSEPPPLKSYVSNRFCRSSR
jgi:wyosine [tRNA(Phe)-imidazoG37] synthetase (radical SAM superfamily)